ncbi:hypothetical protein MGSAQ_000559 [marine sediment metagenome]|uniref:Uncharacterized protein n=1 Tax=marine sediment metagenome TaxID=412755 RepID=A0A1B6NWW5_9ZZZZ
MYDCHAALLISLLAVGWLPHQSHRHQPPARFFDQTLDGNI